LQFAAHPFESVAFPSSQTSEPTLSPSPQISVQVVGETAVLQFQPGSIEQVELHPSKLVVSPSSQVSTAPALIPSPQTE